MCRCDEWRQAAAGCGEQILRGLVMFEDFTNLAQQRRSQPADRFVINDSHATLYAECFYPSVIVRMGRNFRAGAFRIARVQNPDRNVLTPCRQQGVGMKNLRAEVSQLGGFIKTHSSDASRLRT